MKKFLLQFLIATICTLTAKSQTSIYHPFPDSNAVWNNYNIEDCGVILGTVSSEYSITFSNDTVINSLTYHTLITPFAQVTISGMGACGSGYSATYQGAIRQDTTNRIVYIIPPLSSVEQILFDFNMQVGDTVQGYLTSWALAKDTVESIDSILIGSTYRKRWNIDPSYGISLIEGIGSTYATMERVPSLGMTDASYFSLVCFSQDNQVLYSNTTSNCQLITSVMPVENETNHLTLYPNPTSGNFTITFPSTINKGTIDVYNSMGAKLYLQTIINANTANIQLNNFAKGIYFVQVNDGEKQLCRKIVIE